MTILLTISIVLNILLSVLLYIMYNKAIIDTDALLEEVNYLLLFCAKKVIQENPNEGLSSLVKLTGVEFYRNANKKILRNMNRYMTTSLQEHFIIDNSTILIQAILTENEDIDN